MGKRLLLFTAACLLTAFLTGCSTARKAGLSNSSSGSASSSGKTDSDNITDQHKRILGTVDAEFALKPEALKSETEASVAATVDASKINAAPSAPHATEAAADKNAEQSRSSQTQKSVAHALTVKTSAEPLAQTQAAKNLPGGSRAAGIMPVNNPDTSKAREPGMVAATKQDTVQARGPIQASIVKQAIPDTVEPVAIVLKKPAMAIEVKENNPAPVHENGEEMVGEPKPATVDAIDPLISKYAEIISQEPEEINNYPLFRFIDQWYGTEYKWGGTDNAGIDCSAFAQKLYGVVFGVEILRTTREQRKNSERIKSADDAVQGDLVFFRIHHFRISHVGVYLANGFFVHASASQGVVISNLNNKYWRRRFAGCGRVEKDDPVSESDNAQ